MSATVNEADREAARGLLESLHHWALPQLGAYWEASPKQDVETAAQVIADARDSGYRAGRADARNAERDAPTGWGHG